MLADIWQKTHAIPRNAKVYFVVSCCKEFWQYRVIFLSAFTGMVISPPLATCFLK